MLRTHHLGQNENTVSISFKLLTEKMIFSIQSLSSTRYQSETAHPIVKSSVEGNVPVAFLRTTFLVQSTAKRLSFSTYLLWLKMPDVGDCIQGKNLSKANLIVRIFVLETWAELASGMDPIQLIKVVRTRNAICPANVIHIVPTCVLRRMLS